MIGETNMTSNPTPKEFTIRSNGYTGKYTQPFNDPFLKLTAAVVRQILEQGQKELCEYFGDYHWYLRQAPDGQYEFVASYRTPTHNGEFIEGRGRTPREAILGKHENRLKFKFLGWLE